MDSRYNEFKDKFNYFSSLFLAMVSIGIAIISINLVGRNIMTEPMPILSFVFIVLGIFFGFVAIFNGIRMRCTPKDTRLDDLIKAVDSLKQDKNNISNNKVNMELKIDAADISKMTPEQQETLIKVINNLKDKI
jgi:uncharacterized membrane protein